MINRDGQIKLLEHYVYAIMMVHGRYTPFELLQTILIEENVIVDDIQVIRDAYDFTCDLIDDQNMESLN